MIRLLLFSIFYFKISSILNKNIRLLNGKPLISYALRLAKQCKSIDDIVVSTDSLKIKRIVEKIGFSVPFLRPACLATDSASTVDVLIHAIKEAERISNCDYKIIVLLQPTTPFTSLSSLRLAVQKIKEQSHNSIISLVKAGYNSPSFIYKLRKTRAICLDNKHIKSRHHIPEYYLQTGNIYVFQKEFLLPNHLLVNKKNTGFVVIKEYENMNIDSLWDWEIAKSISKKIQSAR